MKKITLLSITTIFSLAAASGCKKLDLDEVNPVAHIGSNQLPSPPKLTIGFGLNDTETPTDSSTTTLAANSAPASNASFGNMEWKQYDTDDGTKGWQAKGANGVYYTTRKMGDGGVPSTPVASWNKNAEKTWQPMTLHKVEKDTNGTKIFNYTDPTKIQNAYSNGNWDPKGWGNLKTNFADPNIRKNATVMNGTDFFTPVNSKYSTKSADPFGFGSTVGDNRQFPVFRTYNGSFQAAGVVPVMGPTRWDTTPKPWQSPASLMQFNNGNYINYDTPSYGQSSFDGTDGQKPENLHKKEWYGKYFTY